MTVTKIETRQYALTSGYGSFARTAVYAVECVEERGKFYASMNTLNASPMGVGDTPDEAFAMWAETCRGRRVPSRETAHERPAGLA